MPPKATAKRSAGLRPKASPGAATGQAGTKGTAKRSAPPQPKVSAGAAKRRAPATSIKLFDAINDQQGNWGRGSASLDFQRKIIDYALRISPQDTTYWDHMYGPISLAASFLNMGESEHHEVALPMDVTNIRQYDLVKNKWELPGMFKITNHGLQGALCKEIERVYKNTVINHCRSVPNAEFQPWIYVQTVWSQAASFFRTFWFMHPHLSKKQAFDQARALGTQRIRLPTHRLECVHEVKAKSKLSHYSKEMNIMLSVGLRKVTHSASDTKIKCDYYRYKDEPKAQATLKAFYAVKKIKTGNNQDLIAFSRHWIVNAKGEDKENFKQFSAIYSGDEVELQTRLLTAKQIQMNCSYVQPCLERRQEIELLFNRIPIKGRKAFYDNFYLKV